MTNLAYAKAVTGKFADKYEAIERLAEGKTKGVTIGVAALFVKEHSTVLPKRRYLAVLSAA